MTKQRIAELRAQYPVKDQFRAALNAEEAAEYAAEHPAPATMEQIPQPVLPPTGTGLSVADYYAKLYADVFKLGQGAGGMISGGSPDGVIPYFEGHRPRFDATIEMFREFCNGEKMKLVYDLGTGTPFASYYFNVTQGARVRFGHIQPSGGKINERVEFFQINLALDPPALPPGDLTICTECLEHLPVNLHRVRDYLCATVKPGRFLLLSFPLNGNNAFGYERDGLGDPRVDHGHIREFTRETAIEFCQGTGFEILRAVDTFTSAYGGVIKNVLMRRPA